MKNGIYRIDFKTTNPPASSPEVLVVKDGTLNGADTHFTFRGTYQKQANRADAFNLRASL